MIFLISKDNEWSKSLYSNLSQSFACQFYTDDTYMGELEKQNPEWVFFFHWSKIVPEEVYANHRCVVLHTGNLPHHRGGSPLQNQILSGVTCTQVNAIEMTEKVDGGGIYCSAPLTLQGGLGDIWNSISVISYELINRCVGGDYIISQQQGTPHTFKRRTDNEVDFTSCNKLRDVYNHIRSLDADTYPAAFLQAGNYKLEFSRAKLCDKEIVANVIIRRL